MRNNGGCGCGSFIGLVVLIFLGSMFFSSCGKSDEEKAREKLADWKTINLESVNPEDAKFKEELQKLTTVPIEIDYTKETKFMRIDFNTGKEDVSRDDLENFAVDSAKMMATFYKNKNIDKVDFSMKIKLEDERGHKNDIVGSYATYTSENMKNIEYKTWIENLETKDFIPFFTIADSFNINPIVLNILTTTEKEKISESRKDKNELSSTDEKETVKTLILPTLRENFKDAADVEFNETNSTIDLYPKGKVANAIRQLMINKDDKKLVEAYNDMKENFKEMSKSTAKLSKNLVINLKNPNNNDRTLLSIMDGNIVYDFMNDK